MATVRAFAGATTGSDQWSLSRGFKDYLSCCFFSTTSGSAPPAAEGKMQPLTVTDKNDNDEAACDAAEDACESEPGCASSSDAKREQLDEPDGETRHRQRANESSSASSRSGAESDVAGQDGGADTASLSSSALAGLERRSADGTSIRSVETDGSRSRSGSGSRFGLNHREPVNGNVGSGSRRSLADDKTTEMDDGNKAEVPARKNSTSQISIGQESTSTIAQYNKALSALIAEAVNIGDGYDFSHSSSNGGDTIQIDSAAASVSRVDGVYLPSVVGCVDEEAVATGDGEQPSSPSSTVLVHGRDEFGKPATYHECGVDVDFDGGQAAGDPPQQHQQQQIEDNRLPSTDDAGVDDGDRETESADAQPQQPALASSSPDAGTAANQSPTARGRLVTQCGSVQLTFRYEPPHANRNTRRLTVTVGNAQDLPNEERGGASHVQFHLVLLPAKKVRHKTRVRPGGNTTFDESFDFRLTPEDLSATGIRIRLYGCERLRRERMLGECVIWFASIGFNSSADSANQPVERWVVLQPRSNLGQSESAGDLASLGGASGGAGSTGSLSGGSSDAGGSSNTSFQHCGLPELMLGLSYNEMTGRLSVEVIKGSNFRIIGATRPPDCQVKLAVMGPDNKPIGESKTSVRRGQPNPLFKETFMFQVPLFQLADVSLLVSVFNVRTLKRKEMFGWFTIGATNSSEEESNHWAAMREGHGDPVCRWHLLLEP